MQSYMIASSSDFFIAGYVKKHSRFNELRISEFIHTPGMKKKAIKRVFGWAKKTGVQVISVQLPFSEKFTFCDISGKYGPVLTFKKVDSYLKEEKFLVIGNWGYSLGDLELF